MDRLLKRPFKLEIAELEARVAAAEQGVKAAEAELDHYTVKAPSEGVIAWLEVVPGTVSRPGTSLWGEIMDLSEIDVRCELTAVQADGVKVGQPADVIFQGRAEQRYVGKLVYVGIAADPKSGRVPVRVRVSDAKERLRANIDVKVRIGTGSSKVASE